MEEPGSGASRGWRRFILLWALVICLSIAVQVCASEIGNISNSVVDMMQTYGHLVWVNLAILGTIALSAILKMVFTRQEPASSRRNIDAQHLPSPLPKQDLPDFGLHSRRLQSEVERIGSGKEVQCRRVFSDRETDSWHDFVGYFDNLCRLNNWSKEYARRTLLCNVRGQAEAFAYGLPQSAQMNWDTLLAKLEDRFGSKNMKETYIADAKLRRKRQGESFRAFGQALEDLYRKAYPGNLDFVAEQSLSTFLDSCHDSSDFRLAVKRAHPKSLHEAITSAMQEECLRMTEKGRNKQPINEVDDWSRETQRGGAYQGRRRQNANSNYLTSGSLN